MEGDPFRLKTDKGEDPFHVPVVFFQLQDGVGHRAAHHAEISFAVPHIQTARLSDDMVEGAGQEGAQGIFTGAVFPETGAAVIVLGL